MITPAERIFPPELVSPRRWTVEEFEALFDAGLFDEDARLELLAGIIVERMGTGSLHSYLVGKLMMLFVARLGRAHTIRVQDGIRLASHYKPEPDLCVARGPLSEYRNRLPTVEDVLLIVEVADSSIDRDTKVKGPLYAAAGVPEYWIVDANRNVLHVHTAPDRELGGYDEVVEWETTGSFTHSLLGRLQIEEIFGD